MGELLTETVERGRPKRLHPATILKDLGIEKTQSYRYKRIASITEKDIFRIYTRRNKGNKWNLLPDGVRKSIEIRDSVLPALPIILIQPGYA